MRVNIIIKTGLKEIETMSMHGEYLESEDAHVISYIESLYDNLIVIDKKTNIVTVEKQSTVPNQNYYSKLIFELQKTHKCTIDVDSYTTFIDINTTKVTAIKTEKQLRVLLEYTIEAVLNNVEIIIEW